VEYEQKGGLYVSNDRSFRSIDKIDSYINKSVMNDNKRFWIMIVSLLILMACGSEKIHVTTPMDAVVDSVAVDSIKTDSVKVDSVGTD
jgi:hypothetical protein